MSTVASAPAARPRRLGPRTRKLFLVLHLLSFGAWFGIDAVMAVVIVTVLLTADNRLRAVGYQALEMFAVWPLLTAGLATLATGVVLSLGTKYGLLRYWWVVIKVALNVVLTSLVLISLRPGVEELAEKGRHLAAGGHVAVGVGDLIYPPIVSPTALLIAVLLAVFKPWGLIRRRRPVRRPAPEASA